MCSSHLAQKPFLQEEVVSCPGFHLVLWTCIHLANVRANLQGKRKQILKYDFVVLF